MKPWSVNRAAGLLLGLSLCMLFPAIVCAATSSDRIWRSISESAIPGTNQQRRIVPDRYRTYRLNISALQNLLRLAPVEFAAESRGPQLELHIPYPDGVFHAFRIQESPIMEPELASRFPEIKTYIGQGVDDPAATVRFDWTPHGFHAMILAPESVVFVDPYRRGDLQHYISYFKEDYPNPGKNFECLVQGEISMVSSSIAPASTANVNLRTYRLAVGATGEYTQFQGGTVGDGLAAITTSLNRIEGIYEREFAIRMILVANETSVIFTDPATDPYSDGNAGAMLGQNQSTMDSVIGNANYDIAHVFGGAGGGGVAGLGVVCASGSKAWGVTSLSNPVGDTFDVDYVAHEMGHQYNGNHAFNGTTGACGGGRNSSTAYEPGSGSTIMCYAGICGAEDLQPHSDDYFHTINYNEIFTFVSQGGGMVCASVSSNTNNPPAADAGQNYSIPISTPFALTGSGSDPDGDSLTYCWEQFNLGTAAPPNTDNGNRPIFRSFNPSPNPVRILPQLSDILNNTTTLGESLPTTNRTLQFRLSVRDNHAGAGAQAIDSMSVTTVNSAGPFLVTQPNTPVIWSAGSQQTVQWNVAGTDQPPINTANVNIVLSTDGGNTFGTTLVANTPNDGSETITVPSILTTTARIKVEAVGNIYFDLSNANFTIGTSTCLFCDDFEDGVLSAQWTYLKPSWSEAGGALIGTPTGRKAIAIATPAFSGCSTCFVEAIMQTAGGVGNRVWLLGWYLSKTDTVELLMKEESNRWVLKQRSGGKIVAKAKAQLTIDPNVDYVARVTFDGANFMVTIDGTQLITMPAAQIPSGTVGFQTKATTAHFGSIQVN